MGQLTDAGNTTTLAHYQNLLDEIWLIKSIQKYSGSKIKSKSSVPKWLVYNTSLASVNEGLNLELLLQNLEKLGRKAEQAVGAHLLNSARVNNFKVFYWKDVNDEVDFVIQKGNSIISIEFKIGKIKDHQGLMNFSKKFKIEKSILISDEAFKWQEFLMVDLNELHKFL